MTASPDPAASTRSPHRPRIAHVFSASLWIPSYEPFFRASRERGYDVTIICPDGPEVPLVAERGMRWLPISMSRSMAFGSDARAARELAGYFRSEAFDLVHTHNFKVALVARVVAGLTRVPVVVHTLHGVLWSLETPRPKRDGFALLEWIACRFTDMVFAQSQEDYSTFVKAGVVPRERILAIGNGIRLDRFDPASIPPTDVAALRESLGIASEEVLAVCPARLVREKGILELFEAARLLRQRGSRVRIAVAGFRDAAKNDAVSEAEIERAVADGVCVLGDRPDMPLVYAASDIVVLPSWREGLPRALIEGAAMGKPLVATDIRGCREIVASPAHGLLVPVRSPEKIAAALQELADDSEARARMGASNRKMATERYDLAPVLEAVNRQYDKLLRRRAAG